MKSAPATYRPYQRIEARRNRQAFDATTNRLCAELSMRDPEATFIEPPGKYSGVWLVAAFVFGIGFWIGVVAMFT